jgi:hypothetical protein
LDEDSAGLRAADLEDEVCDFNCADVACVADLEDWGWRGLRLECWACCDDQGPDFAGDFDDLGDFNGRGDEVGAVVEVEDLGGGALVHAGLDCGCVVCGAISFGATRFDAEERGGGVCFVLRLRALEDST